MSEAPEARSQKPLPKTDFDLLALLDRLETLLEDMDELGVMTRAETEDLMARIHSRLDETDDDGNQ